MATIIFLPLTLLTGYFVCHSGSLSWLSTDRFAFLGHELQAHVEHQGQRPLRYHVCHAVFVTVTTIQGSILFRYWEIAIPLMIVVIGCFLYQDIIRMIHYLKKKTFLSMLDVVRSHSLFPFSCWTIPWICSHEQFKHCTTSMRLVSTIVLCLRKAPTTTYTDFICLGYSYHWMSRDFFCVGSTRTSCNYYWPGSFVMIYG
jgi:hypothetical protein